MTSYIIVTNFVTDYGGTLNTSSKFVVATHILTTLAATRMLFGNDRGMNSELLAKSVNTNPVVIRRLMSTLREAGIVATKMGPNGGSTLNKDPKDILLSQIYTTVECGNLYSMHHTCPSVNCPVGSNITDVLSSILGDAQNAFKEVLGTKTLQDVFDEIMNKADDIRGKTHSELVEMFNESVENIMAEEKISMN